MTEQERQSFRAQRFQERAGRRKDRIERMAQQRAAHCQNMEHANKSWLGVGIIVVGMVWLLNVLGVPMPTWLFTWPVLLIAAGLFSGLASGFRNNVSIILILIGGAFLARNSIWPEVDISRYVWPIVIILIGIMFLVKRRHWDKKEEWLKQHDPEIRHLRERWGNKFGPEQQEPHSYSAPEGNVMSGQDMEDPAAAKGSDDRFGGVYSNTTRQRTGDDWIDITTLFGGAKRTVISKDFKGGDVTNICGGTELDLTHADIQGMAVIDVVGMWGGIKVAVPPNWEVRLNVTHLMAGTDDRRRNKGQDGNKVLVFTGTMLMAGLEITDQV